MGFGDIGELFMGNKIVIGGDESDCSAASVAKPGKSLGVRLKAISDKVDSLFPQRENFPLTPEARAKFTEKLRADPREFCGHKVRQVVGTDGLMLGVRRRIVGWLPLVGNRTGARLLTEACRERGREKLNTAAKHRTF